MWDLVYVHVIAGGLGKNMGFGVREDVNSNSGPTTDGAGTYLQCGCKMDTVKGGLSTSAAEVGPAGLKVPGERGLCL